MIMSGFMDLMWVRVSQCSNAVLLNFHFEFDSSLES